jgi:CxxC motif-containing protein (DUF1111 family)
MVSHLSRSIPFFLALAALGGCAPADETAAPIESLADENTGLPLRGISTLAREQFDRGDALFERTQRDADGLGPLYVRAACVDCHRNDVRGPGLVEKLSVVEADGVTASLDQSKLAFGHSVRPYVTAGATTPVLATPGDLSVKSSRRIGPPVLGRGYMEAVLDSEIERLEREQAQRTDGIHGRINRVTYASEANPGSPRKFAKGDTGLIGRFGLKARITTLDDFTADAFQGDMGITSPLRPTELPNPDGLTDDARPGVDTTLDDVNDIASYMRLLAIPRRDLPADPAGAALFAATQCAACHAPSLRTRADYPIAELASIDAPVFTDFLLHDLGTALADGLAEGEATSREWRTSPLMGLRFNRVLMHDGRAKTIEEAILAHDDEGSEAHASISLFRGLSTGEKAALLAYVSAL